MVIREGVRRKYLEFRRPRFLRRWEEWLVNKLDLVGGVTEVLISSFASWFYICLMVSLICSVWVEIPWRRETMRVQMNSQLAALRSGTANDLLDVHRGGTLDTR